MIAKIGWVVAVAALAAPLAAAAAQGVPDSITAEGMPAVPAPLMERLARYQNMRSASFQGWLAGRRELVILTRFASTNQVHRVAMPGGARTQLTFLKERVLAAAPRPDHAQLYYMTDQGGAENYQVFLLDLESGAAARLSDGRARHIPGRWSKSGKFLAWSSNARNGTDMDPYILEPDRPGSLRRLHEVKGDWSVADWAPDEARVALIERISINESHVYLANLASDTLEPLTPQAKPGAEPVAYDDVRWSKDGKALYWTTDAGSEFRRLVRYDLSSKTSQVLSAEIPWDIEQFDLSDDGGLIACVANEDGMARLHLFDAQSGQERPAPELPAGQIRGLEFRKGAPELGFTLSSAQAPSDVFSYDLARQKLERWTKSETGGIDPRRFPEPELVHFRSFDGREIPAFVYLPRPPFKPPFPVLLTIHGGPESQFRPAFLGADNYYPAELGVAVVYPNVRGSAGYGKTYVRLDNGMRREDAVKDIGALLDWISHRGELDAKRLAVRGGSYGGFMSLATMTHYSDRLKAGIDIVGVSSFVTMLRTTQSYRRDLRRAEYGDERDPAMRAYLEKVSPLSSASKIKVPILVVAGQNDPRVPKSESDQVVAAVRHNGVPLWYVVGKNEGHGFAKKENVDFLQAVEALFLQQYLGVSPK